MRFGCRELLGGGLGSYSFAYLYKSVWSIVRDVHWVRGSFLFSLIGKAMQMTVDNAVALGMVQPKGKFKCYYECRRAGKTTSGQACGSFRRIPSRTLPLLSFSPQPCGRRSNSALFAPIALRGGSVEDFGSFTDGRIAESRSRRKVAQISAQ